MSASQNLYCPQCGKAVREDDSVCPDCQKELSGLKARVLNAHHKADDQDHPHRFLRGPSLRTSYAGLAVALGFWFQLLPAAVVLLRNKAALLELRRQADMVMEVLSGLSKGRIPDPSAFPAILSSAPAAYVRLVSDQFTSGLVAAGGVGTALLLLFALWRLFEKAGMGGWKCLVPFYNAYCLLKLAEISGWSMLLPFLGMIYSVYVQVDTLLLIFLIWLALAIIRFLYRLNLHFGHKAGYTALAVFLPALWILVLGWGGSDWNASEASDARTFRVLCIAAIACLYGCVMVLSIRAWQNTVRLMDPQNGVTADQMKAAYGNFLNHFGKLLDEASDDDSDLSLVLSSTSPVSTASSESSGVLAEDRDDASSGASRTAGADAQSKQAAAQTQPKQSERARPSQEASAEAEQKQQEAAEQAAQKQKEAEEAREQAIQKQQAAAQARKAELLAQKETADWFESFVSQYNPDNPGAVVGSLFTSECSADTVKDVYNRMASSLDPGKAHSECRVVKQTDTSLVVLLYGYSADDQSDISGCALAFEKAGDSVLYSANVYAQYACPTCGGSGAITTYTTCPTCGGSGQQYIPNAMYDTVMGWQGIWQACPGCGGTGQIPHYETCSACGGWGIAS